MMITTAGLAPSVFGRSVNPISTRGVDYAHHITLAPLGFQTLLSFAGDRTPLEFGQSGKGTERQMEKILLVLKSLNS